MAGGAVQLISAVPVTDGRVFPNTHVGAGANSKHDRGLGVEASVGADSIWRLRYEMPVVLPAGTPNLRLWGLAAATTGSAKVNPKWACISSGANPSGTTLSAETTQTITWSAGTSDDYNPMTDLPLDANVSNPIVASGILLLDLVFETTNWSLAVVSTWLPRIVWIGT